MSYIHSITIYAVPIERTWKGDSNDTKNSKSQKKSTFGVLEKSVQIKRPYYSMSSKFNNTIRIDIDAHYHIHRHEMPKQ